MITHPYKNTLIECYGSMTTRLTGGLKLFSGVIWEVRLWEHIIKEIQKPPVVFDNVIAMFADTTARSEATAIPFDLLKSIWNIKLLPEGFKVGNNKDRSNL
jgi:hypothetical protein